MSGHSLDQADRVISLVPQAFGSSPLSDPSKVLPTHDRGFYFVPNPRGGAPLGPYRREQILEAVRLFRLSPYERIWVTGLNSWLIIRDVFRDAFEGSKGRRLLREWDTRLRAYSRFERPGTILDVVVETVLTIPVVTFLVMYNVHLLIVVGASLLVPVLFWATSGLVFQGRSLGMQVFGLDYVNGHSSRPVRGPEAVLRGVLSYVLFLAGGIEIIYLLRSRTLLSSQILGIKAVFNFEGLALAEDSDDVEDSGAAAPESDVDPSAAQSSAIPSFPEDTLRTSAGRLTVAKARPANESGRQRRSPRRDGTRPGTRDRS